MKKDQKNSQGITICNQDLNGREAPENSLQRHEKRNTLRNGLYYKLTTCIYFTTYNNSTSNSFEGQNEQTHKSNKFKKQEKKNPDRTEIVQKNPKKC